MKSKSEKLINIRCKVYYYSLMNCEAVLKDDKQRAKN